jgi:hypothetical protein
MRRKLRPLAALAIAVLVGVITAGCSNAPAAAATGSTAATSATVTSSNAATSAASTRAGTASDNANAAPGGTATAGTIGTTAASTRTGTGSNNAKAAPGSIATDSSAANAGSTSTGTSTGTGKNANAAPGGTATGSNPTAPAGSGANNSAANREQAVKFADCMRKNGVSKFPDPDASGQLTIDAVANGSSLDTDSPAFKQAISACKDLEPAGFTGHTRTPQEQANALKFAQCIRDNGVKDFPDPAPDAPLVDTNRIPSTAKSGGMSILNAAMKKCRGAAADAGASGGQ